MIGLLCPGQGSQFVGMGRDLAREFTTARRTFEEADSVLGTALSRLCWEGPESELTLTINAQPAILTHTVAVWRILQEERPLAVGAAAGHSLGEFSAYVTADAVDFADAVRLVRRRGELMHRSGQERPGAMAAVIGLGDAAVENACAHASTEVEGTAVAANFNAPGQIVISGDVKAVERASDLAKEAGARRAIPLNVSGAFHSPLMESAVPGLRAAMEGVTLEAPRFPVVSNVTAEPVTGADAARDLLLRQLTSPVRWTESVRSMIGSGVTGFFEVGPGNVLSGLVRRIDRTATARPLGTVDELRTYIGEA